MKRSEQITLGFDNKPATLQEVIDAAIAAVRAMSKNRQPQTISNLAIQQRPA